MLKDHVVVFGGSGFIGSRITFRLINAGYSVTSVSRGTHDQPMEVACDDPDNSSLLQHRCDVTHEGAVIRLFDDWFSKQPIHGLVYAVGNCPPAGFDDEVATPLTEHSVERIEEDFDQYVTGLFNVVKHGRDLISQNGHITVIGSAITRLADDRCPPWLHAGQYAIAKAAQKEMVTWLRRDPNLRKRNLFVHYLAPAAVASPFHENCEHQPPRMLPVDAVTQAVVETMQSTEVIDRMMVPQPGP